MHHSVFCAISGPESPIILGPKGSLNSEWGQRRIAIVHVFCSCIICFAVVPCILHLCFLFSRCAKTMYYSYVQFCWCANEIAVVLCILQLYVQFLFILTYSGFILCLFRYKSGAKPFIPILTVTQWVTVKIGINGLSPNLYRDKHRINPK